VSNVEVSKRRVPPLLLPEWEIVTESEPFTEELRGQKAEKSDEEKLSEYQRLVQDGQAGTLHGKSTSFTFMIFYINLNFI
jgi:hypothetical protein